jgi:hypothetical protein
MAFNILPSETYQQQIATYRTEIEALTQRTTLGDVNIGNLPKRAVRSLTEYDFLNAFINRNGAIRRSHDNKMTFAENAWFNGCNLVVLTVNLGLSMEFFFDLLSQVSDKNLPLQREALSEMSPDHEANIDELLANQALVCAPVLQTDNYDQKVPFELSIPLMTVEVSDELSGYAVRFHPKHINHSRDREDSLYEMTIVEGEELAKSQREDYDWEDVLLNCDHAL